METKKSSGIGTTGVLFIVFLVLKLTGNIDWSWWWITSPIWIPILLIASLVIVISLFIIILYALGFNIDNLKEKLKSLKK